MQITSDSLQSQLFKNFPFDPTEGQAQLIRKLTDFITSEVSTEIFVLQGYAGTGKTSIVSTLVKTLPAFKKKTVLLAPTGRAAKVMTSYSKEPAFTIHKKIYKKTGEAEGSPGFILQQNLHTNTIFIVDEASMIGDSSGENFNSLVDDLFEYVYTGVNCKLILIGDVAQLPPVGHKLSPALDVKFLQQRFGVEVKSHQLREVMRQSEESGILHNATMLRLRLMQNHLKPFFELEGFGDIIRVNGGELQDYLEQSYSRYGTEGTMVICRSNKRANIYNQQIRTRIRWQEDEISAGDLMMVVKNNYFWLNDNSKAGFIANGDIIEVLRVRGIEDAHGFRFANALIRMIDYPDEPEFEVKLLLSTIASEAPSLSKEENQQLYMSVMQDYIMEASKSKRYLKIKKDPFFNALQVKFAYSVTCHKAQGGQWPSVFIEQGYLTDEMMNVEFMRWLYTAVTRASEKLYLVNFNPDFFEN